MKNHEHPDLLPLMISGHMDFFNGLSDSTNIWPENPRVDLFLTPDPARGHIALQKIPGEKVPLALAFFFSPKSLPLTGQVFAEN